MQNRKIYLDRLKTMAIICVIIIHVTGVWWNISVEANTWLILTAVQSIAKVGVPIFLMVTGALLLDEKKEIGFQKIYKQYLPRIILFFLFWAVLYKLLYYWEHPMQGNLIVSIIKDIIRADVQYHLWYIYALIPIYMVIPVIRKWIAGLTKKEIEYVLILWFLYEIFDYFVVNTQTFSLYKNVDYMKIGYLGYVILGYYLDRFADTWNRKIIYTLGIIGIVAAMILVVYFSRQAGCVQDSYFYYLTPGVILWSACVFVWEKERTVKQESKVVKFISRSTLGIYGGHLSVLIVLNHFGIMVSEHMLLASVFLITVLVLSISIGFCMLVEKIPILNRFVI